MDVVLGGVGSVWSGSSEGGGDGWSGGVVVVVDLPHYAPGNYNFPKSTNKIKFFDEISSDRLHPPSWGVSQGHLMPPCCPFH